MSEYNEKAAGENLAMRVLVAAALALAVRGRENPEETLANLINDCAEHLRQGVVSTAPVDLDPNFDLDALAAAASDTVQFVGGVANEFLAVLGTK